MLTGVGQTDGGSTGRTIPLEMGSVPERPVSINDYVLNAGDTLLVLVKGSYTYSYPTQITPTGQLMIMLPSGRGYTTFGQTWGEVSLVNLEVVGYVEVLDLPVSKARTVVAQAFEKFIRPTEVDFVLLGPRLFKINVLGDVQWPGSYLVTPFMRVEDAIDQAGGVTSMGSISNISLVNRKGDTTKVNLRDYREGGKLEANLPVKDGDVIFVPKMQRFVLLRGAVFSKEVIDEPDIQTKFITDTLDKLFNAEHWLEFDAGERACHFLVTRAVLLPQSDLANCYIQRGKETIFFDMQEYLATGKGTNPPLAHGDIVFVPRSERFVYVTGEVRRQGPVVYNEAMTINQYLGMVGGLASTADSRAIRVIFTDGRSRLAHPEMQLEPGATIFVPRRPYYGMTEWISLTAAAVTLVAAIIKFGD